VTGKDPVLAVEISAFPGDATDYVGKRPLAWHLDPREDRPNILAIDVGKTTGWAILHRPGSPRIVPTKGALEAVGSFVGRGVIDRKWCSEIALATSDLRFIPGHHLVVVEDVFLHPNPKKSNPVTMAHLAYYVGAVIALAERLDLPTLRVPASTWQSKLLGRIRRDQGKRLSLLRARQEFGGAITNEHVADAALLGLYVRGPL
jgi:hypothetical protein